jgi:hypothetical protein
MFAKNRSLMGTSSRWTYSVKGDTIGRSILNDSDEVIGTPEYSERLE